MPKCNTGCGCSRDRSEYAFERDGVVPDILTLSKTLGAGLPVAAVVTSEAIEQQCYERGFLFFTTHASDPLAATIALAVMNVIERDGLADRARHLGELMASQLREVQDRCHVVADTRGRGLLQGVELGSSAETSTPDEDLGRRVTEICLERGLHVNIAQLPGLGGVLRIAPPLTISETEMTNGLEILAGAIAEVSR